MKASIKIGAAAVAVLLATTSLTLLDVIPRSLVFGPSEAPPQVASRPLPVDEPEAAPTPALPVTTPATTERLVVAPATLSAPRAEPEPEPEPGPVLTGAVLATVVDQDGNALPGAFLREVDADGPKTATAGDARGRLRLEVLAGEEGRPIHVEVLRDGFASHSESLQLQPGGTVDLGTIVLAPGGALAGRVLDERGRPVAGAVVTTGDVELQLDLETERVQRAWSGTRLTLNSPREVTADDGSFRLIGLADGFVRVWADAPGRMPTCTDAVAVVEGQEAFGLEITLPLIGDENRVAGIVLDPAGQPVPFAPLVHVIRVTSAGMTIQSDGEADAEGRFAFVLTSTSEFSITARDPEDRYGPASAEAMPPGEQELVLQLVSAGSLGLLVLGEQGETVEEFAFEILGANSSRDDGGALQSGAVSRDSGGEAEFRVPDRDYFVRVTAPLHEVALAGPFAPGDGVDPVEVRLTRVPGIMGVVLALDDDEPVPGARVTMHERERNARIVRNGFPCLQDPSVRDEVETDSNGLFVLTAREAGEYVARVERDGYAPTESAPFSVAGDLRGGPLELVLGAGGAIEGLVIPVPGGDPTGTVVSINRGDGHAQTQRVGADGTFRFTGLTTGPWRVEPRDEDVWQDVTSITRGSFVKAESIAFNCDVFEGRTTRFDVRLADAEAYRLDGLLTLDGSMPAGWRAWLCPADAPDFFDAREEWPNSPVGPDGRFELATSEPGTYKLCVRSQGDESIHLFVDPDVVLEHGTTPWHQTFVSGTLTVEGVDPAAMADDAPPFLYVWAGPDGLLMVAMSRPDANGTCRIGPLPTGRGHLVAAEIDKGMDPRLWRKLTALNIKAGEETVTPAP